MIVFTITTKKPRKYESATNFYPLWANIATKEQAKSLVKKHLPKLICKGGLASTANLETVIRRMMYRINNGIFYMVGHLIKY